MQDEEKQETLEAGGEPASPKPLLRRSRLAIPI